MADAEHRCRCPVQGPDRGEPRRPPSIGRCRRSPGVLASKMRKSRCQIDKSSREWTSGVDVGPLAKPSAVAGSRLQSLPLATPNRAHLSPRRRSPQTNTTRWTARKRPRSTAWGGGGSSGTHQCGGGHAASRRQNSGCLRLEPAAVSCANCLEAPSAFLHLVWSLWPTPAAAGRDGLAPGHAESLGLKQTTPNGRGPDWAEERARPAEREERSTLTLRTPVGPRGSTVGPQRRVCAAREKLIQTIDRFVDEPAASETRRPGYDEEGGRMEMGKTGTTTTS